MKLTKATIRQIIKEEIQNVISEQELIQTIGELKQALLGAMQAKKANLAKSELKGTAVGILMDFIPGAATAKSISDLLTNVYAMPDEKRSNTGLDFLNVDDNISVITDDNVENAFIKSFLKQLEAVPDNTKMGAIDMTTMLTDFIAQNYGNTKVSPGN
jgi:hypothetical protein